MRTLCQLERPLQDVPTVLLIQSFADRVLVLVTQVGKVGNLIQASIPPTAPLSPQSPHPVSEWKIEEDSSDFGSMPLPPPPPSIQLTPLLGCAPTEQGQILHSLYASQIATSIWLAEESVGGERKPIIVGISLKKTDMWNEANEQKTFMGVMQMLNELLGQHRVEESTKME